MNDPLDPLDFLPDAGALSATGDAVKERIGYKVLPTVPMCTKISLGSPKGSERDDFKSNVKEWRC